MFKKIFALSLFASISLRAVVISEMNLEEKVGQILMAHVHGEEANEDAKTLIQVAQVGGIIYYNWANGLTSPAQVKQLSEGLQKLAKGTRLSLPLLIAADQEGGVVARLNKGFTIFPGNKALAMAGNPDLAEQSAEVIGQELLAVGINMNLAPDVDVNCNPRNPIIGIRSFGDSPETVVAYGKRALEGYRKSGVISSIKHYPGHGDVGIDSHHDLPVVNKSKEELSKVEFFPFAQLASQADTVMTAHVLVPALDPDHCATLSSKILSYLRKEIGFQGVIFSDSLVMQGVLKQTGTVDEAAIRALIAGCDLLILGGKQIVGGDVKYEMTVADVQRVHKNLVEAVKNGRISEERLNEAVQRVLKLKERTFPRLGVDVVKAAGNQALANTIASLALRVVKKDTACLSSLADKKIAVFAPQVIQEAAQETSLLKLGKESLPLFFDLNPSEGEIETAQKNARTAEVLLFCSYNAWKNPKQIALIQKLLETGKPLILLALRDPLDAALFPKADIIITTFSPTAPSIQAGCDRLIKKE
jgi:beta-N-acetylhexosaminidase